MTVLAKNRLLALLAVLLIAPGACLAATTKWTGNTDTAWEKAGNWDNGVPDENTDVEVQWKSGNILPVVSTGDAAKGDL